ncbi:MAG: hypothetical protein K5905_19355 [Roseibium sp.]|uniref:hypothetical protein n=1 Tax=Roseibium sp. TaxID=1936156 RepID=UPI002618DDCF|nr:hypothetical protein [Roseibium sp.]MCV0427623.1 hypothetical protein [Roseibium sp.]
MSHNVPPDSYETTLTVIKFESGIEVNRISIKSTAAVCIPQPGSIYELFDYVECKELKGVVTKVSYKNAISNGPVFAGSVEVTLV